MTTQVSRRIFDVLTVLRASNAAGARLQDIGQRAGLPRPTAHRLLTELMALGMVEQTDGRRYRLGAGLHALGMEAPRPIYEGPNFSEIVQDLADKTGDTVALAIRIFGGIRFLVRCEGHFPVRTVVRVGETRKFYGSYAAIALMSSLEDGAISVLLQDPQLQTNELYAGLDPATVRQTLLDCVDHTRRHGWFSSVGGVNGVAGMAAVVPAEPGDAHLAIVISGIEARLPPHRIAELAPMLLEACRRISAKLAESGPASER